MFPRYVACEGVLSQLKESGIITGWRDELYPVTTAFDAEPVLLVERAAAPFFGIRAYGVHVNGYVRAGDGSLKLWVGRRSAAKQTWPGKLDHIVAGGQVGRVRRWRPRVWRLRACREGLGDEKQVGRIRRLVVSRERLGDGRKVWMI